MKHLSLDTRARLYAELATLEAAGFPALRAFEAASAAAEPDAAAAIRMASKGLANGLSIARAGRLAGLFTPLDATLIDAGAGAGTLAQIYRRLAALYEERVAHRRTVLTRLALPFCVLLLGTLIAPLPALIKGELGLLQYGLTTIGRVALLGGAVYLCFVLADNAGQGVGVGPVDRLLLRLPWIGSRIRRRNSARFLDTLGLLLEAGLPALSAVPQAAAAVTNVGVKTSLAALGRGLEQGLSWRDAMLRQRVLDPHIQALIATGEAAGRLPEMVLRCASELRVANRNADAALASLGPRVVYLAVLMWMGWTILSRH